MRIKVGQKVKFDPFKDIRTYGYIRTKKDVEGTIVEVFPDHRWFSVQYGEPPNTFKISFRFEDLNECVYFCK